MVDVLRKEVGLEKNQVKNEVNGLIESLGRILASMKLAILRTGRSKEDMGLSEKTLEKTMGTATSKPKSIVKKK